MLGYDNKPEIVQNLIKTIFELATKKVRVEGTEVIPFPMFHVLNGTETNLYAQRVEPSCEGGMKLAQSLLSYLK